MICLGSPQDSPTPLESEAAQLRIFKLFRENFLARRPDGIVISELEYMGRTTAAPNMPSAIRIKGEPKLNKIMEALTADYRRWVKNRDYRKSDVMGIANDGRYAELIEVTTIDNVASAATQIQAKLATLRETVNRIHNLSVDWQASSWQPDSDQMFLTLSSPKSIIRYLCYAPTFRLPAPQGVLLYEIHVAARPVAPVRVKIPSLVANKLRAKAQQSLPRNTSAEQWAREFMKENPNAAFVLRGLMKVAGAALVLAAIILVFNPAPGDEAAAAAAGMWLLKLANN